MYHHIIINMIIFWMAFPHWSNASLTTPVLNSTRKEFKPKTMCKNTDVMQKKLQGYVHERMKTGRLVKSICCNN